MLAREEEEKMDDNAYEHFVGIDWGSEEHEVCVFDQQGSVLDRKRFEHTGAGLAALCDWVLAVTGVAASRIAVVVELTRGALIATLLERGFAVFACNPKQTDRFRDRHSMAGAKDDRRDAFVLGEAGRKDRELLRRVTQDPENIVRLRELARLHAELTTDRVRLENRVREQLQRYFPQMLEFGPDLTERWRLELWKRAPTPEQAAKLRPAYIRALLGRHRIRRLTDRQVVETLRKPKLQVTPGVTEAAVLHLQTLLPQLELVVGQLRSVDLQLDAALEAMAASGEEDSPGQRSEQRDVAILRGLPGAGRFVIATLLAEAWLVLRARDYQQLRALSGVAPVTEATGVDGRRRRRPSKRGPQRPLVRMRRACNERLREALWHWAGNAAIHDPKWRAEMAQLRGRGLDAPHARRIIGDRLLRVLCACLRDGTDYDVQRHAAQAA